MKSSSSELKFIRKQTVCERFCVRSSVALGELCFWRDVTSRK